ncbi:MAG: tetratricopeptide repeat protein [Myxococcaceae bacterium]
MPVNKTEIHNERGIELATRGWSDEAILEFQKAIKLDPGYAPAHDNIANLYAEKGDYLKALQIYLRAIELDPESATVRYNFGCFISNYAAEIALSEYQLATQQESDFPEAHLNLGISLASQGRLLEAIEELQVASRQDPNDAQCSYELACVLLETGKFKEAVSQLRKAVKKDPNYQPAQLSLGACYLEQGFYTEASTALVKAVELEPNDPEALCQLAALRAAQDQKAESAVLFKQAMKLDPVLTQRMIQKSRYLNSPVSHIF